MNSAPRFFFLPLLALLLHAAPTSASDIDHDLSLFLGIKYLHGSPPDVEKDLEQARRLLKVAASAKDPIAYFFLAQTFESGCFLESTDCEYRMWLRRAAEGGNATGQLLYGLELEQSEADKQKREGIEWISKAAEQGDTDAIVQLEASLIFAIADAEDDAKKTRIMQATSDSDKKFY